MLKNIKNILDMHKNNSDAKNGFKYLLVEHNDLNTHALLGVCIDAFTWIKDFWDFILSIFILEPATAISTFGGYKMVTVAI